MSTPFKMKGWSGNQSPIRQKPKINIATSLQNIQKSISNTLKGIGVRRTVGTGKGQITQAKYEETYGKKSPGLGLTNEEKIQAKKSGMSEYQWKTQRSKSGTRANRYARDNKLGKYAVEEEDVDLSVPGGDQPVTTAGEQPNIKEKGIALHNLTAMDGIQTLLQNPNLTPEIRTQLENTFNRFLQGKHIPEKYREMADELKTDEPKTDEGGWITRKGDPWSYKKTDEGYQTKKGDDGTVIDVLNKNSTAYQNIAYKVFGEGEKPVTTNPESKEEKVIINPESKEEVDVVPPSGTELRAAGTINNPHNYYPGAKGVPGEYYINPRTGQTMRFVPGSKNKPYSYEYVD